MGAQPSYPPYNDYLHQKVCQGCRVDLVINSKFTEEVLE